MLRGVGCCYDEVMDLQWETGAVESGWEVRLSVALDRRETSDLFLAGDKLISWPTDGMVHQGTGPIDRSSMFLSEIVARPEGLRLVYESEEAAVRSGKILENQARTALRG